MTSQAWWRMPVILVLGRMRQEDYKFEASLGYLTRPCLTVKMRRDGDIAQW